MAIHEERMAVISTAHLPKEEADLLTASIRGGRVVGMERKEGWLVYTNQLHDAFPNLAYVQGYLKAKGFAWVLFDCDAEDTDELPTFDW